MKFGKKRAVSFLMTVLMVLSLVPTAALAAGSAVRNGTAEVAFGASKAYDVRAAVTVEDGVITGVAFGNNAAETEHGSSVPYAEAAAIKMQNSFNGIAADNKTAIEAVDTSFTDAETRATITAKAYKQAVKNALGLADKPADFTFGSVNKELQPGVYNVPVALRNADRHEKPSNAAGAFPAMAQLTVNEDGTAVLESAVQTVTIGPISDMAYDILYFKEDNYTSEKFPVTVIEKTMKPETMPGGAKEVPAKISFTVPDNNFDGVYLSFTVDAMGPGYPDAWLEIDYANAKVPGNVTTAHGEAKVDQFGKYTILNDITVQDGVIAGMKIRTDNFISETHRPTNEAKAAKATEALKNLWNGMAPTQDNAEAIFKKIMKPQNPDEVIDSVSGATYSAKAIRDSVMSAFGLEYQDEVINVPESVKPGRYEVQIGYYSDVVWHSLVETVKNKAVLTVNEDGTMVLDFETKSGTEKEPLYILGFNGIYPGNDITKELTLNGCRTVMGLSSNDYEDEFFAKGTQVVNHLTFPLEGGINKIYNTNAYLYVPAMKRLNGELSGVNFENGHFNVDIFAKIYWDTMRSITEPDSGSSDDGGSSIPHRPVVKPEINVDNYVDVKGHWAEKAIREVVERELFHGVSLTTFDPEGTMTRGMFVTVLGRLAGVDDKGSRHTEFDDVDENQYCAPFVAWAAKNGIVKGVSENQFRPHMAVTRQEMAVFFIRYCEYAKIDLRSGDALQFADADAISQWAADAVDAASAAKLLAGVGGNRFAPKSAASRAEVASLLARFMDDYSL